MTQVPDLPEVQHLAIEDVAESKTNPRRISDRAVEVVALAIERFGWKQPLVVDRDRIIVVGHTRYRAAKSLGLARVPVVVADDLSPAEIDAYRIADNRTRDFTTWDFPQLVDQLEELGEDFADVLALADWEDVVAQLGDESTEMDLPEEVTTALDGGFQLRVCFTSREEALAAEAEIANMPGVFDVRHPLG